MCFICEGRFAIKLPLFEYHTGFAAESHRATILMKRLNFTINSATKFEKVLDLSKW